MELFITTNKKKNETILSNIHEGKHKNKQKIKQNKNKTFIHSYVLLHTISYKFTEISSKSHIFYEVKFIACSIYFQNCAPGWARTTNISVNSRTR